MPTQCVPDDRCGAVLSGWLKGGHPALADGEVSSDVCLLLLEHLQKKLRHQRFIKNVLNCA